MESTSASFNNIRREPSERRTPPVAILVILHPFTATGARP